MRSILPPGREPAGLDRFDEPRHAPLHPLAPTDDDATSEGLFGGSGGGNGGGNSGGANFRVSTARSLFGGDVGAGSGARHGGGASYTAEGLNYGHWDLVEMLGTFPELAGALRKVGPVHIF